MQEVIEATGSDDPVYNQMVYESLVEARRTQEAKGITRSLKAPFGVPEPREESRVEELTSPDQGVAAAESEPQGLTRSRRPVPKPPVRLPQFPSGTEGECPDLQLNDNACIVGSAELSEVASTFLCQEGANLDAPSQVYVQSQKLNEDKSCEVCTAYQSWAASYSEVAKQVSLPRGSIEISAACIASSMKRAPNVKSPRYDCADEKSKLSSSKVGSTNSGQCMTQQLLDYTAWSVSQAMSCAEEAVRNLKPGAHPLPQELLFQKINNESAFLFYIHQASSGTGLGQMTSIAAEEIVQDRAKELLGKANELSQSKSSSCHSMRSIIRTPARLDSAGTLSPCSLMSVNEGMPRNALYSAMLFAFYRDIEPSVQEKITKKNKANAEYMNTLGLIAFSRFGPVGATALANKPIETLRKNAYVKETNSKFNEFFQYHLPGGESAAAKLKAAQKKEILSSCAKRRS